MAFSRCFEVAAPLTLYAADSDRIHSQNMTSRHPDLIKFDDFIVHAFQIQCPAPVSTDDARCMQNAYTVLREASQVIPELETNVDLYHSVFLLSLSVSEPIWATSTQRLDDFRDYIQILGETSGWEFVDNLMGDQKKCGALYCDIGIRNARVAHQYMTTLASVKPSSYHDVENSIYFR